MKKIVKGKVDKKIDKEDEPQNKAASGKKHPPVVKGKKNGR